MSLQILYEDNHLLALNKPAGVLVHGDRTGDVSLDALAKAYLKVKYSKPGNVFIGVCHRLDRPVSGVLIFARTSKMLPRMNRLFQTQKVKKTYWAVSSNLARLTSGVIDHHLIKNKDRNEVQIVDAQVEGGKLARTNYVLKSNLRNRFLYELHPKTGRSHQLRVAMQSIECPIMGDVKYGGEPIHDPSRILLHCRSMAFVHPVRREELEITAPLPDHKEWQEFEE